MILHVKAYFILLLNVIGLSKQGSGSKYYSHHNHIMYQKDQCHYLEQENPWDKDEIMDEGGEEDSVILLQIVLPDMFAWEIGIGI